MSWAAVSPAAAQTLTPTRTIHHAAVSCAAFSPDGTVLATGGGEWATPDCVRLWDVATGKLRRTLRDRRDDWNIESLCFSPDGKTIAYACDDKIRLWSVQTGRLLRVFSGQLVGDIEISPHNRLLVSGSGMDESGTYSNVQIWDLRTGRRRILPKSNAVNTITFSADGLHLFGIGSENSREEKPFQRNWNAGTGAIEWTRNLPRRTLGFRFSPDREVFVVGTWDAKPQDPIAIWDVKTGKLLCRLHGAHDAVSDAEFSPSAPYLVTVGGDEKSGRSELLLWNRRTGMQLLAVTSLSSFLISVNFSSSGHTLATVSEDDTVQLWDAR